MKRKASVWDYPARCWVKQLEYQVIQQLAEGLLHSACHCGPALPTLAFGINAIKLRLSVFACACCSELGTYLFFWLPQPQTAIVYIWGCVRAMEQKSDWLTDRWEWAGPTRRRTQEEMCVTSQSGLINDVMLRKLQQGYVLKGKGVMRIYARIK